MRLRSLFRAFLLHASFLFTSELCSRELLTLARLLPCLVGKDGRRYIGCHCHNPADARQLNGMQL